MYLEFYNLQEFPFALVCDERYFFESARHAEALANMTYTTQQRKGMVLITGEVGAGKTFVGNLLQNRLGAGAHTAYMRNPAQSAKQLIRAVAGEIGMNIKARADKLELLEQLEAHLVRMNQRGRLVVLVLDEAQDLPAASLEELRLLWNWEDSGQRLIQIVLIGQPELRQRLLEPQWEPLRQRIVLSYHLLPMDRADVERYVPHRLKVAANGSEPNVHFTPEALAEIFAATDGVPRLINVLCDNALLIGYARGEHEITRGIVQDVLRDMTCWPLRSSGTRPAGREFSSTEAHHG